MNLESLVAAIEDIIQDTEYTEDMIVTMINEAVLKVATGDILPGKYQISPPLPDLYSTGDVLTVLGTGYLSLPADFNRDLFMVVDSNGDPVKIEESFKKFLVMYADQAAGSVFRCSVNGGRLHYRDIPAAATTLTVHYYTNPDTLVNDADVPSSIPAILHRKLIVGYVCREIFNRIEDGIEGQKINTNYYATEYGTGLLDLEKFVGIDGSADYYDSQTDYCP